MTGKSENPIRVVVTGACGRMGREVVRAVAAQDDMELAAAVDASGHGADAGAVAGITPLGVLVEPDLKAALARSKPDVLVDFTTPRAVMANLRAALEARVACVVGTTGLTEDDLRQVEALCAQTGTPALVAPNFAIGAVLMMEFAARAARYFPAAEIVELHHDKKLDAPSGTARRTAELMAAAPGSQLELTGGPEGPRGLAVGPVRVHSVRLPGLVAHQEVIFGGLGQTLRIRHDSISRESFMPGVLLAIRTIRARTGLTVGLESIL